MLTRALAACLALTSVVSMAGEPSLIADLPVLPLAQTQAAVGPPSAPELVPGSHVHCAPGKDASEGLVALPGVMQVDRGPTDGLEVLACLDGGKTHEALIRLRTANGALVKAAGIAAFGLDRAGAPSDENSSVPARGWPVRVQVMWEGDTGWRQVEASSLVRDRAADRPYPALPYVWTGSRMIETPGRDAAGAPVNRQSFGLDLTKSVLVNYDEPDTLLASPFPDAAVDRRFEANSRICPPAGTEVWVVLTRATLPLTLVRGADGVLSLDGKALDDGGLAALLAKTYGGEAAPALRAIAIRVAADQPRTADVETRALLLAAAAKAKAWVVPVFVPAG
jgi:hypothetical protein